jgi:hypothetical protein
MTFSGKLLPKRNSNNSKASNIMISQTASGVKVILES